ncbi:hypothetical protein EMPS_06816 [Entomortierella parvispora]|uniref:DUF7330 domain-containing protein n=1 Tax=Entomortierella parvispora TaxID=205924 RepID=A0A9P3HDF6_9FUNG|nr:hypothetical protein EMPS_06816 [Entomortierella parvispora]
MSTNNGCNHSVSKFPPICCVHNGESRPLLGHHNHDSHYQQPPQAPQEPMLPPYPAQEYRVDMTNEKAAGQHNGYLPMYSAAPVEGRRKCKNECRNKKKSRFCKKLFAILLLIWVYHNYVQPRFFPHTRDSVSVGDDDSSSNPDIIFGDGYHDVCKDHAVDWEGPSSFTTSAKNFKLKTGKGNLGSHVKIVKGDVSQPTLQLSGLVTPTGEEDVKKKDEFEIVVQGVHLEISESEDLFEAFLWFEDRWVDEDDNHSHGRYRACARFEIEIIVPESFTEYGSVTVEGGVIVIDASEELSDVSFELFKVKSAVGHFVSRGLILADQFRAWVNTGKVEVAAVQSGAVLQGPLDVEVKVSTGHVFFGVKTTPVSSKSLTSSSEHHVEIASSTGAVKVDVSPADGKSSKDASLVDLNLSTSSKTGSVQQTITLENDQALYLRTSVNTGSVKTQVSDNFLGHFSLATQLGSTHVSENPFSESEIVYEKQTARAKEGNKHLKNKGENKNGHGSIDLKSSLGSVNLEFF